MTARRLWGYCTNCGVVEWGPFALSEGVAHLHFRNLDGVLPQVCPKCGKPINLIEGAYSNFDGRLDIILDPHVPPHIRVAVLDLIRQVQTKEITLGEAQEKAGKLGSQFRRIFDISNWSSEAKATLFGSILIAAATIYAASLGRPAPADIHIEQQFNIHEGNHGFAKALRNETVTPLPQLPRPRLARLPRSRPKGR